MLTYLIKDPKKSKPFMYWERLWFFVLITDFTLIPYTITTGIEDVLTVTKQVEVLIDILWICHIIITLTTAFYRDSEIVTDLKEIVPRYMKEYFFIDLITTFPTLGTWYFIPDLYYLKLLRLLNVPKSMQIVKT